MAPIFRDFGPDDLKPLLDSCDVARTVLVQATDTIEETRFLLGLADRFDFIAGVVGWVDLAASDAPKKLDELAENSLLKGIRPMLQSLEDVEWILQPAVLKNLEHAASMGLVMDALVQPRHLPVIAKLLDALPQLPLVVDHMAKPEMAPGAAARGGGTALTEAWRDEMARIAGAPRAFCKLSGMVTEIGPDWRLDHLVPFAEHVFNCFGPDRVMWGSDWPVVNLVSSYQDWLETAGRLTASLSDQETSAVFGQNAIRFYDLTIGSA